MASGSYTQKSIPQEPAQPTIPLRAKATRLLPAVKGVEEQETDSLTPSVGTQFIAPRSGKPFHPTIVVDEHEAHPLTRYIRWLVPLVASTLVVVLGAGVLLSAAISQRYGNPQLVSFTGGQAYTIQNGWVNTNGPIALTTPVPAHLGPYSVLGKPSLIVDFMNQVLASYNSPARGKAQALYNYGVKYNIDPAFALAFFLHESTFGTAGEARESLSLGNLRCIPNVRCQDGYAWFSSWEQGFEAWYKLIRNLYVAKWGLFTIDQIIPVYAPSSDNNDVAAYISSLKHSLDTWHAGNIRP